jgi:hypothetical protein
VNLRRLAGSSRGANSGKLLDGEKDNWRPDFTVVEATVQYLQETGRLTYQPEEGQVGQKKDLNSFTPISQDMRQGSESLLFS